ncbi:unnamed protein product [Schistosoma rodhaini]|nr:unnamed protein product [Schistosoma rodhaini]
MSRGTGTRCFDVLKKATPDGKLSLFLDRRTFVDHFDHVDPIDGILTMTQDVKNTEYVFLIFTCSYRFGRDDLDVLGLTFQKELLLYTKCLWPNHPFDDNSNTKGTNKKWNKTWKKIKRLSSKRKTDSNEQISCTITNDDPYGIFSETLKETDLLPFQTKLLSKHGDLAFPFRINIPTSSPSSVAIQPNEDDSRKLYGVSYTLTAFAGQKLHSSQPISSTVTIILRRYIAGPKLINRPLYPVAESTRKTINFLCYSGEVVLTASIEKPLYYHDESVDVLVVLDNYCNLSVRKLQIAIVQVTEMYLLTRGTYRCTISEHLCKENLPQAGEQQWKYTTALDTSFTDSILKQGVALEGYIKQEKNWLASSTILKLSSDFGECLEMMQNIQKNVEESTETAIKANKELHGVVISYFVRVRCWIGISRFSVHIPFLLMQPEKEPSPINNNSNNNDMHLTTHTVQADVVENQPIENQSEDKQPIEIPHKDQD